MRLENHPASNSLMTKSLMIQENIRDRRLVTWVKGDRRCVITLRCKAFALLFYLFNYRNDLITRVFKVPPNVSNAVALLKITQRRLLFSYLSLWPSYLFHLFLDCSPLEDGTYRMCWNFRNYQWMQQNIQEQGRHNPLAVSLQERFILIQFR